MTHLVQEKGGGEFSVKYSARRTKSACFSRTFTRTLCKTPCRISVRRSDNVTQLNSRSLFVSTCMTIFFTSFGDSAALSEFELSSVLSDVSMTLSSLRLLRLPEEVVGTCKEPVRNSGGSTCHKQKVRLKRLYPIDIFPLFVFKIQQRFLRRNYRLRPQVFSMHFPLWAFCHVIGSCKECLWNSSGPIFCQKLLMKKKKKSHKRFL